MRAPLCMNISEGEKIMARIYGSAALSLISLDKIKQKMKISEADAISVQAYKEKAQQAKKLLDFCEGELRQMEQQFTCG